MIHKTKIFFLIIFCTLLGAAGVSFAKFYIAKDYFVKTEVECDPESEGPCFVWECDPETEECAEDPEENIWIYKYINKKANRIAICGQDSEECEEPSCFPGEKCEYLYCTEDNMEDWEECLDEDAYLEEMELEVEDESGDELGDESETDSAEEDDADSMGESEASGADDSLDIENTTDTELNQQEECIEGCGEVGDDVQIETEIFPTSIDGELAE